MKAFNLTPGTMILRFYLMMLIVIVAGFTRTWALAFLALPILMACLWGIDLSYRRITHGTWTTSQKIQSWIRNLRTPAHHTA